LSLTQLTSFLSLSVFTVTWADTPLLRSDSSLSSLAHGERNGS
jgi:hypothetical protein